LLRAGTSDRRSVQIQRGKTCFHPGKTTRTSLPAGSPVYHVRRYIDVLWKIIDHLRYIPGRIEAMQGTRLVFQLFLFYCVSFFFFLFTRKRILRNFLRKIELKTALKHLTLLHNARPFSRSTKPVRAHKNRTLAGATIVEPVRDPSLFIRPVARSSSWWSSDVRDPQGYASRAKKYLKRTRTVSALNEFVCEVRFIVWKGSSGLFLRKARRLRLPTVIVVEKESRLKIANAH